MIWKLDLTDFFSILSIFQGKRFKSKYLDDFTISQFFPLFWTLRNMIMKYLQFIWKLLWHTSVSHCILIFSTFWPFYISKIELSEILMKLVSFHNKCLVSWKECICLEFVVTVIHSRRPKRCAVFFGYFSLLSYSNSLGSGNSQKISIYRLLVIYSDSKYLIWNFASELFFFLLSRPSQFFAMLNAHGYRYKDRGWFARTIHFVEFMRSNESFDFGYEIIQHRCRTVWFKISDFFYVFYLILCASFLLSTNISISFFIRLKLLVLGIFMRINTKQSNNKMYRKEESEWKD